MRRHLQRISPGPAHHPGGKRPGTSPVISRWPKAQLPVDLDTFTRLCENVSWGGNVMLTFGKNYPKIKQFLIVSKQ